ncbi:MAG: hypothetical protein J0H74_34715 [Chitinophagaceae bacterium]|nr:hypothetical protein [Chitinophagaceae bacterium]
MKPLSYSVIIFILALFACKKAHTSNTPASVWQLVQKRSSIGGGNWVAAPSWDSLVVLQLNFDGTYVSRLNNHIVSQGAYSITTDTSYYIKQILELKDFKATGIFGPFTVFQLGTNGQVVSTFSGFFMTIDNNTLTLSSVITPGGNVSYTFARR